MPLSLVFLLNYKLSVSPRGSHFPALFWSFCFFTPPPTDPPPRQTWRKRITFLSYIFHMTLAHIYSCMTFANGIKQLMATQSKTHCSLISSPAERQPHQSFPITQFIHGSLQSFYQIIAHFRRLPKVSLNFYPVLQISADPLKLTLRHEMSISNLGIWDSTEQTPDCFLCSSLSHWKGTSTTTPVFQ